MGALLHSRYQVNLEYSVSHYDGQVKFEFNDRYHCIIKKILNKDDLQALDIRTYYFRWRNSRVILTATDIPHTVASCAHFLYFTIIKMYQDT